MHAATRSQWRIWRHGRLDAASRSSSVRPRARASTSVWSRTDTMSWSRNCGERSLSQKNETAKTTNAAQPAMTNWLFQWVGPK